MEARSALSIGGEVFLVFDRIGFLGVASCITGESTAIFCVKTAGCCWVEAGAVLAEAGLDGCAEEQAVIAKKRQPRTKGTNGKPPKLRG